MSVVLWDINSTKREKNSRHQPQSEAPILSLDEYYEVARRCIGAFASGFVAKRMLGNEDAISFVAEYLMYGSHKWEASRGRTLHSYLNQCAIWAIQRWILLSKKAVKNSAVSLTNTNEDRCLSDIVADKNTIQPDDDAMANEGINSINNVINTCLSGRQKECIELVYINGYSGSDAARKLGLSRQAVHQFTTSGIQKIKEILHQ